MIGSAVCIAILALLVAGAAKVAAHGRRLNLQRALEAAERALDDLDAIEEAVNLAAPGGMDDHRALAAARIRIIHMRAEAVDVAKQCRRELLAKGVSL